MNNISGRLKRCRESIGKRQADFAETMGVTERTYINWEQGKDANADKLKNLSVYGINLHWLLTGEGEMYIGGETKGLSQAIETERSKIDASLGRINRKFHPTVLRMLKGLEDG